MSRVHASSPTLTRAARSSSSRAKPLPAAAAPRGCRPTRGEDAVSRSHVQTGFPPAASGTTQRQEAFFFVLSFEDAHAGEPRVGVGVAPAFMPPCPAAGLLGSAGANRG
ncbi:uncharacterized protein VDAG_02152 [Verticillium dahliae VdLs.17]|uniref:Uncharacterized protein n=1 Tax=Verticillium dahliae (strain VdLs.17 / ATCC MYA-4575 / FGSC 10137) TaxID=498257 RepID=G2WV11_VERDV|nr:uncharacterized protein VDAG_02152 [Verticillium dahliae VdLs.17]EGY20136.1 hypothetical protein VDAG_02152 [Verticillium dahliae VdLs.17]